MHKPPKDEGRGRKEANGTSNLRRRKPPPKLEDDPDLGLDEKDKLALAEKNGSVELPEEQPHPDEHQIKLDTDRSFVLYSVGKAS